MAAASHEKEGRDTVLSILAKEVIEAKREIFPGCEGRVVSGAGNVAIYATEKAQQYGAKVIALRFVRYVYDPNGIQLDVVKEIRKCAAAGSGNMPTLGRARNIMRAAREYGRSMRYRTSLCDSE